MNILDKIVLRKKQEISVAKRKNSVDKLKASIKKDIITKRDFIDSLKNSISKNRAAVIAEIKKASPSKGVLTADFNVEKIAKSYEKHNATCLSILTDEYFFQGSYKYLINAKNVTNLPVIRKDFIIDEYQIYESKVMGADCILLIIAILTKAEIINFTRLANDLNMDVLVEVHNEKELNIALKCNLKMIGINNRDLKTFNVDLHTTLKLKEKVPQDILIVTESGILKKADVKLMQDNNINCFLVGEAFMRTKNPGKALKEMFF